MHRYYFCRDFFQYTLLLFALSFALKADAQDSVYKAILQGLYAELPEDTDLSELEERLNWFSQHPINLNSTTNDVLSQLLFLSPLQIHALFDYLKHNGKLINLLELQAIPYFDVKTVEYLLPFVTINQAEALPKSIKSVRSQSEQELLLRYGRVLEHQKGFSDLPGSRYLGDPGKMLLKYKFRVGDMFYASFIAEKDAGEPLFKAGNGVDFSSWQVSYKGKQTLAQVVLGDYSLQFGQGLSLWSGFGYGKGADVTTLAKSDAGLRPYTSTNELSFLRGIAIATKPMTNIVITTFASSLQQDASLRVQPDGTTGQITISESGLHRTATEIRNKDVLKQQIIGGIVQYRSRDLEVGILAYHSTYDHPFITGTALYNRNNFVGTNLSNGSIGYSYTFRNLYIYGEAAKSFPGGWSTLNGLLATFSKSISVALMWRVFGNDHYSFMSHSLGENSDASNEHGWYCGINYHPNSHWLFSVATDWFSFPLPKYRIDAASSGYEHVLQVSHSPSKMLKIVSRIKMDSKAQNDSENADVLAEIRKWSYRLGLNWQINSALTLDSRVELMHYQKLIAAEHGILLYQDIAYKFWKMLKFSARLAWFRTDSYNSRLYAYEDDILYSSGFGLYQGKGFRSYINASVRASKKISIYLRYGMFIYPTAATVGSGLDVIVGNRKSELKVQLRLAF